MTARAARFPTTRETAPPTRKRATTEYPGETSVTQVPSVVTDVTPAVETEVAGHPSSRTSPRARVPATRAPAPPR